MSKSDLIFIIKSFLVWRIGISIIALFAIRFVPLFSHNYFGGSYTSYSNNPLFWGHLNFDGEHYLSIAQNGYQPFEYFFFPIFPYLIRLLSFANTQIILAWTGLFISNLSFFISLTGIYKLVKLDYKDQIAKLTITLLLIFPTSFYFGAFYTESLFLALIVWSFYFFRTNRFFESSITSALASATRIVGGVMTLILFLEMIKNRKFKIIPILISPLGVLIYMYYLLKQTGDPLIFLHQISIFGQQRSSTLTLLPQVFYRYIFEILPHVTYSYFPNVFTTYLEFFAAVIFLSLIILGIFKLRASYSVYAVLAYLIPTLAGSFSSMPRYVLIIFPIFILGAFYIDRMPKFHKYIIFSVMLISMIISIALFWRGYWIS